jgi:hypothetical protein
MCSGHVQSFIVGRNARLDRPAGLSYNRFWKRRYRLTVRTEPSQGLNTGSIPVSATNSSYTYGQRVMTGHDAQRPSRKTGARALRCNVRHVCANRGIGGNKRREGRQRLS